MNKPTKIPATAYILIGGESKRFGSLKWQTTINGQTILDRIWDACDGIGNRYVIGKKKPDSISYPFIKDELEINAPINGLYTALKNAKTDWILLLSCDLPLIDSNTILELWNVNKTELDAIVPMTGDQAHPLCAFYHTRFFMALESRVEKGEFSLKGFLDSILTKYVEMDDPEKSLFNMNTMEDFNEIKVRK
jgi:molybdopterin-guanine dinucleotide biosynthesis protein A